MQALVRDDHEVFPYRTLLFTSSPLLAELYCESHRFEPWAVTGSAARVGHYTSTAVLYVPFRERRGLKRQVIESLTTDPGYSPATIARVTATARDLVRGLVRARRAPPDADTAGRVLRTAAQVLSVGVYKEVLEPDDLLAVLARFMPVEGRRRPVLDLYQPHCLPHYIKFELCARHFAARYAQDPDPRWVHAAIARCAHHARFLLEPTEYADPAQMQAHFEHIARAHGPSPRAIQSSRRSLLQQNRAARQRAFAAESDLLTAWSAAGRATLHSRRLVRGLLRFVRFMATYEELKHILVMQAARAARGWMDELGLDIAATDHAALLSALRRRSR